MNYEKGCWVTEGTKMSPPTNTLLADTGPLWGGIYDFVITLGADVNTSDVIFFIEAEKNSKHMAGMRLFCGKYRNEIIHINGFKIFSNHKMKMKATEEISGKVHGTIQYVCRKKEDDVYPTDRQ